MDFVFERSADRWLNQDQKRRLDPDELRLAEKRGDVKRLNLFTFACDEYQNG
jgi:hypothetical protein